MNSFVLLFWQTDWHGDKVYPWNPYVSKQGLRRTRKLRQLMNWQINQNKSLVSWLSCELTLLTDDLQLLINWLSTVNQLLISIFCMFCMFCTFSTFCRFYRSMVKLIWGQNPNNGSALKTYFKIRGNRSSPKLIHLPKVLLFNMTLMNSWIDLFVLYFFKST